MKTTSSSPAVSIILPCRNERDGIAACLDSVLRQEPPPGGFEVVVADGMSDDGTRPILERFVKSDSRLKIVDNPNRIVSTGLNAAIAAATGRVIIRMDAHTQFAPDYVRTCVDVLEATGADNVGGPWVAKGEGTIGRAIAAAFQSPFAMGRARGHDPAYEGLVDTVYLGCWKRPLFDRVGVFDEELVRNQDDEFNLRLTLTGGRIWQSPRIRSWYTPRNSLRQLFNQYKQYGYWKVRVIQKHRRPASIRHLVPAGFFVTLTLLTAAAPWSSVAAFGLLALAGTYALSVGVLSLVTAATHGWSMLPYLPTVFACYHLGYGYGFTRGFVDFVLMRRQPARAYSELTRERSQRSLRRSSSHS